MERMSKWLGKFRKAKVPQLPPVSAGPTLITSVPITAAANTFTATVLGNARINNNAVFPGGYAVGAAHNHAGAAINGITTIAGGQYVMGHVAPNNIIQFSNNNAEIVSLKPDGSVVWANGIQVDEAAAAFARSLTMGAELVAGINKKTKMNMRDSVFEDIIAIAKEKGSLTAEDLTYLLEASKIIEKLKGGRE